MSIGKVYSWNFRGKVIIVKAGWETRVSCLVSCVIVSLKWLSSLPVELQLASRLAHPQSSPKSQWLSPSERKSDTRLTIAASVSNILHYPAEYILPWKPHKSCGWIPWTASTGFSTGTWTGTWRCFCTGMWTWLSFDKFNRWNQNKKVWKYSRKQDWLANEYTGKPFKW